MRRTTLLLFSWLSLTGVAEIEPERAARILRDSCQRCHDHARVAFVRAHPSALPAIRRSARFNLEAIDLLRDPAARQRAWRAIESGGMPFADMFRVDGAEIYRDTFLESHTGRDLMDWLRD